MRKHLLTLFLIAPLASCDEAPTKEVLVDVPPPALRNVMFEIDALNYEVEPILRAPDQIAVVASSARSMLNWANDEAWEAYYETPDFLGDRIKFDGYLGWLRSGIETLATSAEAGDIDGMRKGFILANQACTACHKRFQPNI